MNEKSLDRLVWSLIWNQVKTPIRKSTINSIDVSINRLIWKTIVRISERNSLMIRNVLETKVKVET